MRKAVIFILSICMTSIMVAQENKSIVEKGMVLTLGEASPVGYHHIDFPKNNIISKRGAIANFNNLEGRKVVVEDVFEKNGKTHIVLKRKDGLNFFRFWPTVTTDIESALANGELKLPTMKKNSSLNNG